MSFLEPGYIGYLEVNGDKYRITSGSINYSQTVQFYDHTYGLWDNKLNGGEEPAVEPQKPLWRPSVSIANGDFEIPVTNRTGIPFLGDAVRGGMVNIKLQLNCSRMRELNGFVNKFSISCQSEDFMKISVNAIGVGSPSETSNSPFTVSEKLLTWDKVRYYTEDSGDINATSFTFEINNNVYPIYACNSQLGIRPLLRPAAFAGGIQEISGTVDYYNDRPSANTVSLSQLHSFKIDAESSNIINAKGIYEPSESPSSIGVVKGTAKFTGVGNFWNSLPPGGSQGSGNNPFGSSLINGNVGFSGFPNFS